MLLLQTESGQNRSKCQTQRQAAADKVSSAAVWGFRCVLLACALGTGNVEQLECSTFIRPFRSAERHDHCAACQAIYIFMCVCGCVPVPPEQPPPTIIHDCFLLLGLTAACCPAAAGVCCHCCVIRIKERPRLQGTHRTQSTNKRTCAQSQAGRQGHRDTHLVTACHTGIAACTCCLLLM